MRRMIRSLRSRVTESLRDGGDLGMTTAEYAVGTVAACGFGTVLYKILTSDSVISLLGSIISRALHLPF